jgi:restriction system protein
MLIEATPTVPRNMPSHPPSTSLDQQSMWRRGLDGRTDLLTMDPFAFEHLVRELLLAMSGQDARVTRPSRDDGIDGVVFDCSATLGGEFIVQAKRYRNVVPANDIRALAGVMHDKRANHASS